MPRKKIHSWDLVQQDDVAQFVSDCVKVFESYAREAAAHPGLAFDESQAKQAAEVMAEKIRSSQYECLQNQQPPAIPA